MMKKSKAIFWIATGIFSLMMLFSSFMYLTSEEIKISFEHLGFPDYFRVELGIAKLLGALTLLLSFVPKSFKYFAYAGFTINLVSAVIAHAATGDPVQVIAMPFIFLVILVISYIYFNKLQRKA